MVTVIGLKDAADAFKTLRLTNSELFGETVLSEWIFRGQPSHEQRLLPVVWRDSFLADYPTASGVFHTLCEDACRGHFGNPGHSARAPNAVKRLAIEYCHLRNFAEVLSDVGLRSWGGMSPLEDRLADGAKLLFAEPASYQLTVAQHYGSPTRLLDWTLDPLTALSFALSGTGSARVAVWAFNRRAYQASKAQLDHLGARTVTVFSGDVTDNEYLKAQRGVFSFIYEGDMIYLDKGEYPAVEDLVSSVHLLKFEMDVTADDRSIILKMLMRERRTQAHLMPDHNAAARLSGLLFKSGLQL